MCATRDRMVQGIREWLIGPLKADESFKDLPSLVYSCGMLHPKGEKNDRHADDQDNGSDRGPDGGGVEGIPNLLHTMKPSAAGLSFTVRDATRQVRLSGSFALYFPRMTVPVANANDGQGLIAPANDGHAAAPQASTRWHRIPIEFTWDLQLAGGGPFPLKKKISEITLTRPELAPNEETEVDHVVENVVLDMRVASIGDGYSAVTCTLVNQCSPSSHEGGDDGAPAGQMPHNNRLFVEKSTIFQVCLVAEGVGTANQPDEYPFVEAPIRELFTADPDSLQHALLYRRHREIAVGHGAGSAWSGPDKDGKAFSRVELDFIPSHRVQGLTADRGGLGADVLGMQLLAGPAKENVYVVDNQADVLRQRVLDACDKLVNEYESWVEGEERGIDNAIGEIRRIIAPQDAQARIREQAEENIRLCRESIQRMRHGIDCLKDNALAMRAFNMANLAMWMQTKQVMLQKGIDPDANPPAWRPFQLAFLLMTIRSIVDPGALLVPGGERERDIVDLIWFPTGGGKTEAYLGLMAFTLLCRRLRCGNPDDGAGVGVLTRYTLRLLTSQQFERATRMICALEKLRRTPAYQGVLGQTPFKIGLFVGSESSPNSFDTRHRNDENRIQPGVDLVIRNIMNNNEKGNKKRDVRHLRKCPWCGTALRLDRYHQDYVVVQAGVPLNIHNNFWITEAQANGCSLQFRCPSGNCFFGFDNIQEGLPAQIIDQEILREPPSVIIGTVDKFAMLAWNPKTRILFGRGPGPQRLHPAPDLVIQDELHLISGSLGSIVGAYEAGIGRICQDDQMGRPKVIGATATIRRSNEQIKSLFSRDSRQFPPQVLTGGDSFFASTDQKSPGRLYLGVQAPSHSAKVAYQKVAGALLGLQEELGEDMGQDRPPFNVPLDTDSFYTLLAYFNSLRELAGASVLAQDNLAPYVETKKKIRKEILGLLAGGAPVNSYFPQEMNSRKTSGEITEMLQRLEKRQGDPHAVRLVHATNMVSVGVDVDRLGLMLINGMPKNTAEYIQASSRVGRKGPGLVVAILGWTKSRDRSHYERFKQYHQAFYREVEATSVTPWTSSVRDSVLGAVCAMVYRHLSTDGGAQNPPANGAAAAAFSAMANQFLEDVRNSDPEEVNGTSEFLAQLREYVRIFAHRQNVEYGNPFSYGASHFLRNPSSERDMNDGLIPAPTSMRDVETESQFREYP